MSSTATKKILIILSFLIPCITLCFSFYILGLTPFGNETLLICDAHYQYSAGFQYAARVLRGECSPFYSFSLSGGQALCALPYYLYIPVWFVTLAPDALPTAFSLGIIVLTSLCGTTMYFLLKHFYGHKPGNLIFSTCYALIGFNVVYNINYFFLYSTILLPLMVLGLCLILEDKSPLLYILSIAFSASVYLMDGLILCLFSALLFLIILLQYLLGKRYPSRHFIVHYVVASVCGGLLGAAIWIPSLRSMSARSGLIDPEDYAFVINFNPLDFITRLFSGASDTAQLLQGLPAVFCGILPLYLLILYFMNRQIPKKEKLVSALLLGILFLIFLIRTFNSLFQGAKVSNFDYRYSFIFSFLILLIAAREYSFFVSAPKKDLRLAFLLLILFGILGFSRPHDFTDIRNLLFDLLILLCMLGLYGYSRKKEEPNATRLMSWGLLFFCCIQLCYNYSLSEYQILKEWHQSVNEYEESVATRAPLLRELQTSDESFYRMESETPLIRYCGFDGLFFGYNGLGQGSYVSSVYASTAHKLGLNWTRHFFNSYDAGIPAAMDSFWGLRYIVSDRDLSSEKGYIPCIERNGLTAYQNPYALPIAMLGSSELRDVTFSEEADVFALQNELWKALTGCKDDLFLRETVYTVSLEQDGVYISFDAARDGSVYLYDPTTILPDEGTASMDDDPLRFVGRYKSGDTVHIPLLPDPETAPEQIAAVAGAVYIYYADDAVLSRYAGMIRDRYTTVIKESDTCLSGDFTAEEGQILFFSIPYHPGWQLMIDDTEVPLECTLDCFMSAPVTAGDHHYVLTYDPKLSVPLLISLIALIVTVLISLPRRAGKAPESSPCAPVRTPVCPDDCKQP